MVRPSLFQIFLCFLKIGFISFGGFMSLVSMIETQVVEKRKWISNEDMLDGISLASLLPGPMAVNTVAYVGYRLRGAPGALVSAVAVLLPTTMLMIVLTDLYFRFGSLPEVERVFGGILPAVAAIVLSVCLRMAQKNIKSRRMWAALVASILLVGFAPKAWKIYATFGVVALYGFAGYLVYIVQQRRAKNPQAGTKQKGSPPRMRLSSARAWGFLTLCIIGLLGIVPLPVAPNSLVALMTTFASMSLTLFGGGYVFIPMIQEVVVERFEWVTSQEFIDGIALGQITPGPILISAAFIGQKVAGITGALLSTVAIFTPPAMLMVLLAGMLDRIKSSPVIQSVLTAIRVAVIGLIFKAFMNIFMMAWPTGSHDIPAYGLVAVIFLASFIAMSRFKVDVVWIIPLAGLLGLWLG